jgi:nucleolar GTP-binding protein
MKLAIQTQNKPMVPRAIRGKAKDKHDRGALDAKEVKMNMDKLGVDSSKMIERGRAREREERGKKRARSLSARRSALSENDDVEMDEDISGMSKGKKKKAKKAESEKTKRDLSLARSHSRPRTPSAMGLRDENEVKVAAKLDREGRKGWMGAAGEGDNRKSVQKIKWMNTGKKRMGTHYCR